MFKSILKAVAMICIANAQEEVQQDKYEGPQSQFFGRCPVIKKNSLGIKGKKINVQRLMGLWKTVYESSARTQNSDCVSMKIQEFEGSNQTQFQLLNGQFYNDNGVDNEIGEIEAKKQGVFYDDDSYFTFNNPNNTGQAALQTKDEIDDPDHKLLIAQLKNDMRNLTEEEKKTMTADEIGQHEEAADYYTEMWPQIQERLLQVSPYDASWHVLDTDYDNFVIFWNCIESSDEFNAAGQTPDDIRQLKEMVPGDHYDMKMVKKQYYYQIVSNINVRSLDSKVLTKEKFNEYVNKLHTMIPDHDFKASGHGIVTHGKKCPADTIDIFTLPGAKKHDNTEQNDQQEVQDGDYGDIGEFGMVGTGGEDSHKDAPHHDEADL